MKSAAAILAISASAFALPAAAQMNTSNLYVGATIGQSHFKGACDDAAALGLSSCDNEDTAWRILAGYQINPNFSAELGYHNLGSITVATPTASGTADVKLWELVALGAWPIGTQFSVYGKLGGYRAKTSGSSAFGASDESNTGWTYGLGAGWEAMRNLGLRVEWQQYRDVGGSSSDTDVNVLSVGALWRFR
jgi:OOP family OmpA-OmpF porin